MVANGAVRKLFRGFPLGVHWTWSQNQFLKVKCFIGNYLLRGEVEPIKELLSRDKRVTITLF